MRILVTGGAGFIGSHLCERLLERGHDVICLDNFFTGRKQNVAAHLQDPSFELVSHDVVEPIFLEVDQIYHLACPASPVHYQSDPYATLTTSVLGALRLAEHARLRRVRIIHASTSEVYGDPQEHPQRESYWGHVNPHGTRSCYDEGKRAAESLVMDYHRQNGVDVRVVRIFNTYGPRMLPDDGRVVSNFIVQALSGDDLTVYGEGEQTRSFCYVDDLVDGLIRMMNSDGEPGPVNLGNPEETTVKELALRVMTKVATRSRIVHKPVPLDDPTRRRPDITLARTRLDWEPRVALDEGLDRTIAYFRGELS